MDAVCKARITDYFQDSMITLLTDWLQAIFRQKSVLEFWCEDSKDNPFFLLDKVQ